MAPPPPSDNINDNWWHHAVIYHIYTRSFMDSNDDGIGDIPGITLKMRYFAELGVTAIWLSPIYPSPMVDGGYDISDYMNIHPDYGTMDEFETMIKEAVQYKIKVILDFVPNHTSDKHEWFQKSASGDKHYVDYYVWKDGKVKEDGTRVPPNNWRSVFGGSAWTWHEDRKQYYLHQFAPEQPDLNFRTKEVMTEMEDILAFWMMKGVAGFRVDALNHLFEEIEFPDEPLSGKTIDENSYDYLKHIHTKDLEESFRAGQHFRHVVEIHNDTAGGPMVILLCEAYTDIKKTIDFYETVNGMRGPHFPLNFSFVTELDATSDARDFVFQIHKWMIYMPQGYVPNWVLGNHDNPRAASRFNPRLVDALHMMLFTLPGVAITYNGEEIGMRDYRDLSWGDTVDPAARNAGPLRYREISRDPVRTPFHWDASEHAGFSKGPRTWLPVHPDFLDNNVQFQSNATKSHLRVYKSLVDLRRLPVLQRGKLTAEPMNRKTFVLKREIEDKPAIYTIINVSGERDCINLSDLPRKPKNLGVLVASSFAQRYEKRYQIRNHEAVMLEPYEGVVCVVED